MLKLYNVNKEKIEGLTKYKDLVKERDLKKGEDTLSFSYPKSLSRNIKEECYIETKFNFYVIKEIDNSDKDWINVVAKVNTEDLKSKTFPHFEMVNSYLKDTLNLALAGTGWTIGHNNIVKRRTVRVSNKTPLEVIDEIRKAYRAEIFYDAINKKVNVYEKLGEDKGDFFMEDVNLKSLNISSDSYDYVTRLIPLGKDGLTIEEINNGKKYVENYQYSDKIIYATWEDNRYTVVENLKEDAISKLEELSKPYKSYEADVIDLRGANLGDTITLISKTDEVKEKQRVVKITEYPDEPWNNKVEIANKTYTFEEMQSEVMDTVETADTVLTSDGMVDESKIDFNPIRQEFVTIIAEKADIVDLNAANARIGDLEVTKANVTDLEAVNARIDNLDVEDLTAINADITALKVSVGDIEHLLAGNITAENIGVGAITAGSGIIADGAIGDAQINAVTAGKIKSGTLDTSLVTVAGADGKLNITGNRLQVIHEGLERVALGDVNRDGSVYGLRVRGKDGETVLFDERGLTREGLTDGAINDSKVDDAANIQGHKLDINSVIREVNDADEVIKGTKIQVGDRTLDVELSTQKIAIDENKEEISNQRSEINALDDAIKLKVDNQIFNQYKTITDENITTINTQLSKNTASINILQEEINLKVSQTDVEKLISEIDIVGRNLFLDTKNYGSKNMSIWDFSNGAQTYNENFGGLSVVYITRNWHRRWQTVEIEGGETYTLSCWVKSLDEEGKAEPTRVGRFGNNDENSKATILKYHNMSHGMIVPKKWARIGITFKFDEESTVSRIRFEPYCVDYQNNQPKCLMAGLKLEKGNKPTDWTPALGDFESEITAINTKAAGIDITLDDITSRVSSTESNITKVNDEVSTIESRVSIAERKITDDSIINTVRNSTAYKNDLDGKANESDLKVAESIIEQHTDEIAKRVTIDGLGSEIIQNANSVRVAVGKIGAINLIQFSNIDGRGKIIKDKYVYDGTVTLETKALYEGISIKIPQIKPNTEYTLSFKYKKLDGSLKAFGGHTDSTYSNNIATVDGKGNKSLTVSDSIFVADDAETHEVVVKFKTGDTVSPDDLFYLQPNRSQDGIYVKLEITELQFEEGDYVTAWNPYPGEGEGPGYLLTGDEATFKNTSLKIINENNYPVFEGTTDGMLKIMAQITTGYQIGYNLSIIGNSITFEYAKANEGRHQVGSIAAGLNPFGVSGQLEEGIGIDHSYGRHISIGGWTNTGEPYSYLVFDRENRLGYMPEFPVIFLKNVGFYGRARHMSNLEVLNNNRIYFKTGSSTNEPYIYAAGANGDWLNLNAYNFAINGVSGTNPRLEYQASTGKTVLFTNTHVNKNFTVSGSKNSLQKTKNYGDRLLNAYETAEYFFGDIGSGRIDEGGLCYIYIDDIFQECVNTEIEYHVFLQQCGRGDVWIKEKHETYFIVEGTEGLEFSWELKAKRQGYEYHRLEQPDNFDLGRDDSVSFDRDFEQEDKKDKELEKIYGDKLKFDLSELLLKEVV